MTESPNEVLQICVYGIYVNQLLFLFEHILIKPLGELGYLVDFIAINL